MTCTYPIRLIGVLSDPFALCSTFTPNLPLLNPARPVTADDLERDRILAQRIELFKWVEPSHLDAPDLESDDPAVSGFLDFARQGILLAIYPVLTLKINRRIVQSQSLQGTER